MRILKFESRTHPTAHTYSGIRGAEKEQKKLWILNDRGRESERERVRAHQQR